MLLNRGSGAHDRGTDPLEVCRLVEKIFLEAGHQLAAFAVAPEDIERELALAITARPEIIIAGGGDGTVATVAGALGGTGIALGVMPLGTFNLAARDFGVPLEIEAAARFLAEAEAFPVDVLDVNGHACLCTTILGFYPEFSEVFEARDHGGHWWRKTLKLCGGLRRTFASARPLRLSWESDGGAGLARTKFSAFVPGRYIESAGLIPARTDFQCGTLTGYISAHRKPASALRGIIDYAFGRLEQNPELQIVTARKMTLRAGNRRRCSAMIDGEILKLPFPLRLEILPMHLKLLTTATALGRESTQAKE